MNEPINHIQFSTRPSLRVVSIAACFVLAGLLLGAGSASAQERRPHEITWGHGNPGEVSRFVVLISPVSPVDGSAPDARQVSVGKPPSERVSDTSMHIYRATVSFNEDEFLAVAAVGRNGLMSGPSDWRGVQPSRPGQPVLVQP